MSANVAAAIVPPLEDTPTLVVRDKIVAFVNDDYTAAALRTGLEGSNLDVRRGTIRHAIKMLETDTELFAVVADITGVKDPLGAVQDLSRVCPSDVLVALVGDDTDMTFYRTVVNEMGATEYLSKPLTRDSVQLVLRPKFVGAETDQIERGGHVVAVCGAQGGSGATSITINLALQLAETTKAKVALLDLHLQDGEAAVMLGVQPGPGLRKALEDPMRADSLFLERAAIDVNDRVKLIAADESLDIDPTITEAGVRHVVALLRQRFNFVVVDMPMPLATAVRPVVAVSRHVFVLLEAEVTGLRNANALRTVVTGIAGKNRVFTVLNRANRAGGLPLESIVKGLGAAPDMIIPDLGSGMTQAVNLGVPALNRVTKLRRHLAPIVQEVAGINAGSSGWLRRLLGR